MDELVDSAEMFKVLSDSTRLRLIKLLSVHEGALCVNALARKLGVTQSAVSQHLRILRQAGLVHGDRRGHHVHYALDKNRLAEAKSRLLQTLGEDI